MPIVACDDDNGLSEYSCKPPALAVGYMTPVFLLGEPPPAFESVQFGQRLSRAIGCADGRCQRHE